MCRRQHFCLESGCIICMIPLQSQCPTQALFPVYFLCIFVPEVISKLFQKWKTFTKNVIFKSIQCNILNEWTCGHLNFPQTIFFVNCLLYIYIYIYICIKIYGDENIQVCLGWFYLLNYLPVLNILWVRHSLRKQKWESFKAF